MSGEPALTREVLASLSRADGKRQPTCSPVIFGVGGLPLLVTDLIELGTRTDRDSKTPLFLGAAFDDPSGDQPKREVLLDALRRAYPNAAGRGVKAPDGAATPAQNNALTIAIRRVNGRGGEGLLGAAGALLHKLEEGRIRSRPAVAWDRWSDTRIDWLTHGDESLQDPGDALTADVMIDVQRAEITVVKDARAFRVPLEDNTFRRQYVRRR